MLRLNGTYWLQESRVTTIQSSLPMVQSIKTAMGRYFAQSGGLPDHVFVYRAGASEGEYKKVRRAIYVQILEDFGIFEGTHVRLSKKFCHDLQFAPF